MRSTKWRCFNRDRGCFGLVFGLRSVRDFVASTIYAADEPRICPICACSVAQSSPDACSVTVEPYVFHVECFKCAICALRVSPSADPQVRSGGQRVLCRKCVKNGCRPTQPQVRLSVIARNSPRHSIAKGALTTIALDSRRSSRSSTNNSRQSHTPRHHQVGHSGSSSPSDLLVRPVGNPSPVPSLSEYLEAAEESVEAAASNCNSRAPSPSPLSAENRKISESNLSEKNIEENALLGAPVPSNRHPAISLDQHPLQGRPPKPRSMSTPTNAVPRNTVPKKIKVPPASTGHHRAEEASRKFPAKVVDTSFSTPNGEDHDRRVSIRNRRALDPLFLNPELTVDKEDDDIHDLSDDNESVTSKSCTINVESSKNTTSAAAQKALEHILDFKQETPKRNDFEGNDLGAELRQLEDIGVPCDHLEKIAAALGDTSFVSSTLGGQHRRHASEGGLSLPNQPRVYPGGKSPRGDFTSQSSDESIPVSGHMRSQTLGNPPVERLGPGPHAGLRAAQRAHTSLAMLNPSLGLLPRPPSLRSKSPVPVGTLDNCSSSYKPESQLAAISRSPSPPTQVVELSHDHNNINACQSEPHVGSASSFASHPIGTPTRRPSMKSNAPVQQQQQQSKNPSATYIPRPAASTGSSLHQKV